MGPRSSKRNSINIEPLSADMIRELCQDTGFTKEELLIWHTNFYKDCPDGKLTLKQFEQEYAKIMGKPTQKTADYIKHMFNVYDQDKNQFIDFREFVMALSAASVFNRLRLIETLFHVFDLDNDGKITRDEIGKMLQTLTDVTNSNNKNSQDNRHQNKNQSGHAKETNLQKRIDDAFNELNGNDDDHITKDEFIDWYMKSGLISDVQPDESTIQDSGKFNQFGKKSRKITKQTTHRKLSNVPEETNSRKAPLNVYISKMIERKKSSGYSDDEYDDDITPPRVKFNNNPTTVTTKGYYRNESTNGERVLKKPSLRLTTASSNDIDSEQPKENERWQHLYNSILGQIRAQNTDMNKQITSDERTTTTTTTTTNSYNSRKNEAEESIRLEHMNPTSNNKPNRSNISTAPKVVRSTNIVLDDRPSSPDVITVRL
ncbi:unnamed protein product [Adineta steineri]|uniref:EF-hand domain-containing protein n=1 Tax=Adineta steineri TaxID=433720 RepID=A0A815M5I4_9BILA|nr:unnamed protein product [Adineta steineri]CAF1415894.1 unnamed protein product [Adineta steineri]CAF1437277.1 unnamed protein product [Adineta steineri]